MRGKPPRLFQGNIAELYWVIISFLFITIQTYLSFKMFFYSNSARWDEDEFFFYLYQVVLTLNTTAFCGPHLPTANNLYNSAKQYKVNTTLPGFWIAWGKIGRFRMLQKIYTKMNVKHISMAHCPKNNLKFRTITESEADDAQYMSGWGYRCIRSSHDRFGFYVEILYIFWAMLWGLRG